MMAGVSPEFSSGKAAETIRLEATPEVPNHPRWPVLVYRQAIDRKRLMEGPLAEALVHLFEANGWERGWIDGIFSYHHYHSTAHEVLGVAQGRAAIQFGGPSGPVVEVSAGDVVILPAGTGHKLVECSGDFTVSGAYPEGQEMDLVRPGDLSLHEAERNICAVERPPSDPVLGRDGPLKRFWVQ